MSLGILKITKSTVVIAISGIMGPGSDTEEVWVSIRSKNKERSMHYFLMSGNRDMNREYAAEIAIRELYHFIKEI
jgi:nicotinamide mononucleotide (NMN) deamidase PncC